MLERLELALAFLTTESISKCLVIGNGPGQCVP
jgi:hypothetical protein